MNIQSKIDTFEDLERGWNGYGAPPIPEQVIELARKAAECLEEDVEVFPTGRESIQFEFGDTELEIFGDRSVTVLKEDDSTKTCAFEEAMQQYGAADEFYRVASCDSCGREEQVDVSDLKRPAEKEVASRAGFAVTQDYILCPGCWDAVKPI